MQPSTTPQNKTLITIVVLVVVALLLGLLIGKTPKKTAVTPTADTTYVSTGSSDAALNQDAALLIAK